MHSTLISELDRDRIDHALVSVAVARAMVDEATAFLIDARFEVKGKQDWVVTAMRDRIELAQRALTEALESLAVDREDP